MLANVVKTIKQWRNDSATGLQGGAGLGTSLDIAAREFLKLFSYAKNAW